MAENTDNKVLQLTKDEYQQLGNSLFLSGSAATGFSLSLVLFIIGMIYKDKGVIKASFLPFIFALIISFFFFIMKPKFNVSDKYIDLKSSKFQ